MKKLLAIAVATAISAPAMADLTIGGSADYRAESTDGNMVSTLETNLDFTASTQAENGLFAKTYIQVESFDAGDAGTQIDIDDNYLEIGNASASLKVGGFAVMSAWATGDDDWQVDNTGNYAGHGLWLANGTQDAALTLNVVDGVSVQYATTLDSTDTDAYQLAATVVAGGVTVVAEYEDAGTDATKGFAASVSTTVSDVAVNVSYAKNEADTSAAKFMVGYNGLELNVMNDDTSAGANETSWYGSYKMALPVAGTSLTVGAGASDASDTFGARIDYKF